MRKSKQQESSQLEQKRERQAYFEETRGTYEKNKVIVYIWTSCVNQHIRGGEGSVGHVSIWIPGDPQKNIDGYHVSCWPAEGTGKTIRGYAIKSPAAFVASYERDKELENHREANVIYCFSTLDCKKMRNRFEELTEKIESWKLYGRLFCEDAESCASLAYRILFEGGLRNLLSKSKEVFLTLNESCTFFAKKPNIAESCVFPREKEGTKVNRSGDCKGLAYSAEMGIGPLIQSPDKLALILAEARKQEKLVLEDRIGLSFTFEEEKPMDLNSITDLRMR